MWGLQHTGIVCVRLSNGKPAGRTRLARVAVDGELAVHEGADLRHGVGHDGRLSLLLSSLWCSVGGHTSSRDFERFRKFDVVLFASRRTQILCS